MSSGCEGTRAFPEREIPVGLGIEAFVRRIRLSEFSVIESIGQRTSYRLARRVRVWGLVFLA